jgi:hypothetical protein
VKPGITGYAAVYGGRNASAWRDRLKLDVYYVHHVSFWLDVKIFFKTFSTIFSQEGVYVEAADTEVSEASVQDEPNKSDEYSAQDEPNKPSETSAQDEPKGNQ